MRVTCAALLVGVLLTGCARKGTPMDAGSVEEIEAKKVRVEFEAELARRGFSFTSLPDGRYRVTLDGGDGTVFDVSVSNLERTVTRDRDPKAIAAFVDQLVFPEESRTWEEARGSVYFSAERNDQEFGDTIRRPVSRRVDLVLVVAAPDAASVLWVTPSMLENWGVAQKAAEEAAGENLDRLLEGKRPEVEDMHGSKLGMVPVGSVFKASLIFAPHFRAFVEKELGWPVLAVTPCRDFMFVFPADSKELMARTGAVIVKEYQTSSYPITTEVWRVSDAGVESIGAFDGSPPGKP